MEAAVLKMRADLMGDLREFIRDGKLTQAAVARRLGIGQSRVSDLVRGKWQKFNLEMLITLAARGAQDRLARGGLTSRRRPPDSRQSLRA